MLELTVCSVHEMNADTLLQVFLPYHDSQNFARVLAIISLPSTSPYAAPFAALTKKAQPVPREYIVTALSSARDPSLHLLTDVAGSLVRALDENTIHRALLGFWTATLVDLLERSRTTRVAEGVVKVLVEAFVTTLSRTNTGSEVNAAVYPPLVLLSRSVRLADGPFAAVVEALLTPATGANPSQRVLTLLVLLDQRKGWQGLGEDAPARLAKIPQIGELLVAAMEKYGFEAALQTVVGALIEDVNVSQATLATIVDYAELPSSVVQLAAAKLLTTPSEGHTTARALLSTLRQRHPSVIDSAVLDASATLDPALVQWSSAETAFVDVHSADVASRTSGVKEMYAVAEEAGLTAANAAARIAEDDKLRSAQTAILARLRDTDEPVLKAIYAKPELLLALLTGADYVDAVTAAFVATKPERTALGLHLGFIANSYLPAHVEAKRQVFEKLLVPNLLATEERRAFGPEQWPLVTRASRLLVRVNGDIPLNATKDQLVKFNQDVIKNLAGAISACGDIGARVDVLVAALSSPMAGARLLATLALAQLVSAAGGYQHVVAARSLAALDTYLAGKPLRDVDQIESPLSDELIKSVVSKPSNSKTLQRAYLALLTSAASVQPSPNTSITWLSDVSATERQVRDVTHALYAWANSINLSGVVAKHLLHAVFGQLGEEVLLFLAAVWTGAADSALRVAALRHATAFVKAYTGGAKPTDFQLAIPAALIALQDSAKPVRQAGADLLSAIAAAPLSASADIYALENIYGSRSDLVQLLKPSDLTKYLEVLTSSLDDMVVDAGRLALVHGKALEVQHKGGKDTSHRRDVVDWLMSHVLGWRAESARRSLLSSLTRATNVSRLHDSLPLLTPLLDASKDEAAWLGRLSVSGRDEYLDLVFDAFAARHASVVTETDSEVWALLLRLVDQSAGVGLQLRALSLQRMADGLFGALRAAQKAEYVVALIHSLKDLPTTDDNLSSKAVLAKLNLSAAEIMVVLGTLLQPLDSPVHRKKVKHGDNEEDDKTEQAVASLTVFVESRDWKALRGDAPLVATLMGVLSSVLTKRQAIKEGVDYLEQEVLGAILAQLEQITDADAISRAHVGLEVIVKVIRASTNPRTSQRALLAASELARLVPDAVLHNVMPIFTFMGSSDLQRDDAFSFGVVEKTIARIVPVMTKSLKDKATTKLELYLESRTFLSIFTDMAARLPKHRTLPFFVHLVKSLGADDFLAPVCMLLADRSKGKNATLELPLGLAATFSAATRTDTLAEVVSEAAREIAGDEDTLLPEGRPSVLLLLGAGLAKQLVGKVCPQPVVLALVRELISLSSTVDEEVAEPLESALTGAMQLLSVASFLEITANVLETAGDDVARTLNLFTSRLALIKPELRAKSSVAMATIIKRTAALLSTSAAVPALAALEKVVATALPSEDSALAGIMPTVVAATKGDSAASTLALVAALVRRLGPRGIPFIQMVLDTCLALARAPPTAAASTAAFSTIAALVETVPTFVSAKQLVALLGAVAAHRADDQSASANLIAAIAKRIPTKTLIPVVMDLWKNIKGSAQAPTEAFFALLKHALRHADRKALPGLTKQLFAFFLDVFDVRHGSTLAADTLEVLERSAINSFLELVTKLSDTAFKPLFGRLYDWAVVDLPLPANDAHVVARRIVLLRVMDGLLDKFRNLLTPYMGTLLPLVDELLAAYSANEVTDSTLWTILLSLLAKSFDVDEGAYWTDAAFLKLLPALVSQLGVFPDLASAPDSPPAATLAALAAATASETTLKKVNTAICLATRADEPKARMGALRALDSAWERHADELIQFVPETVAEFLAELLEDENAEVEGLARKVLTRIEGVTGSLKEYLE